MARTTWRQWPPRSTADRARCLAGERPPKLSTPRCNQFRLVLRQPIESTQYLALRYRDRLAEAGVQLSIGSVGVSYDNALGETISGLFKAEVIHRRGPGRSSEAVEFATLEWVDWFNNRRLFEPIGNIPPAKAEACYNAQTKAQALAA